MPHAAPSIRPLAARSPPRRVPAICAPHPCSARPPRREAACSAFRYAIARSLPPLARPVFPRALDGQRSTPNAAASSRHGCTLLPARARRQSIQPHVPVRLPYMRRTGPAPRPFPATTRQARCARNTSLPCTDLDPSRLSRPVARRWNRAASPPCHDRPRGSPRKIPGSSFPLRLHRNLKHLFALRQLPGQMIDVKQQHLRRIDVLELFIGSRLPTVGKIFRAVDVFVEKPLLVRNPQIVDHRLDHVQVRDQDGLRQLAGKFLVPLAESRPKLRRGLAKALCI